MITILVITAIFDGFAGGSQTRRNKFFLKKKSNWQIQMTNSKKVKNSNKLWPSSPVRGRQAPIMSCSTKITAILCPMDRGMVIAFLFF